MVSHPPPWARHNGYFLPNVSLYTYKKKELLFFKKKATFCFQDNLMLSVHCRSNIIKCQSAGKNRKRMV